MPLYGLPVIVLAITIGIVPVPHRTAGRVGLEQCVGHLDRVENQRIIGTAGTPGANSRMR
jgi:hypothetical protein